MNQLTTPKKWLLFSGFITMLPLLAFLVPSLFISTDLLVAPEESSIARFYFFHWCFMAGTIGALIAYGSYTGKGLRPILAAALVEKAALVFMIISNIPAPFLVPLIPAAFFDSFCVVGYGWYLAKISD